MRLPLSMEMGPRKVMHLSHSIIELLKVFLVVKIELLNYLVFWVGS